MFYTGFTVYAISNIPHGLAVTIDVFSCLF